MTGWILILSLLAASLACAFLGARLMILAAAMTWYSLRDRL